MMRICFGLLNLGDKQISAPLCNAICSFWQLAHLVTFHLQIHLQRKEETEK